MGRVVDSLVGKKYFAVMPDAADGVVVVEATLLFVLENPNSFGCNAVVEHAACDLSTCKLTDLYFDKAGADAEAERRRGI